MKFFKKDEDGEAIGPELQALQDSLDAARLPPHIELAARSELERLIKLHPSTAEYSIGLNYLDFLLSLPWTTRTPDTLDIRRAEAVLNSAHFGLVEVKERILEHLAVGALKSSQKHRILVVDDEEIARQNLAHVFQKEGYEIQTAKDGEEALAYLERADFEVVVTDLKMGRVDGVQVLERARAANPDTEVVMVTAYATVDSAVQAFKKGAFHFVPKPYRLEDIRQTVREILDRRVMTGRSDTPMLCLVGPPGTGKTSLGRSIARALGRRFTRLSLAGMKDEAEIRGHRRTYAGAMPGRIIQQIQRIGVNNPVFVLDEIDKAIQGFKGDPTSALLEILDPVQNRNFTDYYVDLPFDLSRVLFIATANVIDPLPEPLLDRMEVITLTSYTDVEKEEIAFRFIIPEQIRKNALTPCPPKFTPEAVLKIIREYTREAGLRNLEREVARLCRKLARVCLVQCPKEGYFLVTPAEVETYLGPRRYHHEAADAVDRVGVTTGLFWTVNGGEIVFIEATMMRGKSELILTGSLGEVMRESAQAALSYLRANAAAFHLPEDFFSERDIHIHVPAGAIAKDGPSAGLTIALALLSLLTGRPARRDLASTGELTLTGRLLRVGGIRDKVLAARRGGVRTLVMPEKNRSDFLDLPGEAREGMEVVFANSLQEITELALLPKPTA